MEGFGDLSEEVEREVRRSVGPVLIGAKNGLASYRKVDSLFFPFRCGLSALECDRE